MSTIGQTIGYQPPPLSAKEKRRLKHEASRQRRQAAHERQVEVSYREHVPAQIEFASEMTAC